MKITAKQFAKSPLEAYRRADRGEEVIIEHARYPDITFHLIANPVLKVPHLKLNYHALEVCTLAEALMKELLTSNPKKHKDVSCYWQKTLSEVKPDSGRGLPLNKFLVRLFNQCITE